MFSIDIGGKTFTYPNFEQIAKYCYEMARTNREALDRIENSRGYYVGKAEAYGTLAVVIGSIRIAGAPVEKYIEDLQEMVKSAQARANGIKVELDTAYLRIEALEKLVQDVDHIGDANR